MQVTNTRQNRTLVATLAAILLAALFWSGQTASAQEAEWQGTIEAMPSGTLEGQWTIGGRTFVAGNSTEFRQEKGAFAVGVCAEVEYVGAAAPFTATKIATKNGDDCRGGTSTPGPSPSPDPSETPTPGGDEGETYGVVESMPAGGFIGRWTIGGAEYDAAAGTEFDQEAGPFVVGACVKVHFQPGSNPRRIREMETKRASSCNNTAPTPDVTATPSDEFEVHGRVDALPDGLIGTWTVDGVDYTATGATEFQQEDGAFAVGACVNLHARNGTSPATIREIETERDYRCGSNGGGGGGGSDDEAELYGVLQSFPAGLTGTWNVAGMSFVADGATEFKQEHGPFAMGVTVKVHFSTDSNGVNHAREIETKFANDDRGGDDDGNGSVDGAEGHAYGQIDSFPASLSGTWQIGGVEYVTDDSTRFQQEDGAFAEAARVKVEYFVNSSGGRTAKKIERTGDEGGASSPSHAVFFGFVRQMPAGGLVGTWMVDNATFIADSSTEFKEHNGLLGIGAYVAVEYLVQNGENRIHEIETHVPPGAGTEDRLGIIGNRGIGNRGGGVAAADVQATWVIAGVSYSVLPATQLNDQASTLDVGSSALVNYYVAGDGSRVATRIRGVTVNSRIFLPTVLNR